MSAFFFFVILGTKPVIQRGQALVKRFCPSCGDWRNFQAMIIRNYFTFFFIPVFPLGAPQDGYACVTCGLPMDKRAAEAGPEEGADGRVLPAGEALVVQCPRCDGRMRVPLRARGFTAVCPHCSMEFKVKGQREPVPEAETRE